MTTTAQNEQLRFDIQDKASDNRSAINGKTNEILSPPCPEKNDKITEQPSAAIQILDGKADVKWSKLSLHIAGFLQKGADPPEQPVAPVHPHHIALTGKRVKIYHDEKPYEAHTISLYRDSLHDVISKLKNMDSEEYHNVALPSLHMICQGIKNLHKQGIYLGRFNEHTIIFSCDKSSVVTTDDSSVTENATVQMDLLCLAKVFYFVLTRGNGPDTADLSNIPDNVTKDHLESREKELAKDIIEKVMTYSRKSLNDEAITAILQHPFFWNDLQKLTYVCDAFDFIKDKIKKSAFKEKLDKLAREESVVGDDWFRALTLRNHEMTDIRKNLNELRNKGNFTSNSIQKNIIKQFAEQKCTKSCECYYFDCDSGLSSVKTLKWEDLKSGGQHKDAINAAKEKFGDRDIRSGTIVVPSTTLPAKGVQNGLVHSDAKGAAKQADASQIPRNQSFCELLQFFRNQQCHFWEIKELVRLCFQDQTTGFWRFFSSRFPKLLCFIFNDTDFFNDLRSVNAPYELDGKLITKALGSIVHTNAA